MKERPILFSGPMVQAVLDNHKTQTRRVITPQPTILNTNNPGGISWAKTTKETICIHIDGLHLLCPYGQVGDRLWVRETWATHPVLGGALYRADNPLDDDGEPIIEKWRPSIFMPRNFSRILLEITGVRVERVQAIATNGGVLQPDIRAEGVGTLCKYVGRCNSGRCPEHERAERTGLGYHSGVKADFKRLWDKINEPRGFGWESNPWVWVVEFKRI